MCECEIKIKNPPGKGRKKRKKKMRELKPNLNAILANARNHLGRLPDDFSTNPRKYRKDDSEISR